MLVGVVLQARFASHGLPSLLRCYLLRMGLVQDLAQELLVGEEEAVPVLRDPQQAHDLLGGEGADQVVVELQPCDDVSEIELVIKELD